MCIRDRCISESKLGIGILTLGGKAGAAYQRIVGPEHQGKGVEEKYTFIHGSKVGISPQLAVGSRQSTVGSRQSAVQILLRESDLVFFGWGSGWGIKKPRQLPGYLSEC